MVINTLSEMGTYHRHENGENQDKICYAQNRNLYVISLADGVSSCRQGKYGAEIASSSLTNLFVKKGGYLLEYENEQIAELALSYILFDLKRCAGNNNQNLEEYSSTIASVLVDKRKKRILCFNLGDGIILGITQNKCRILSMPSDSSSGCCVTTTKGATKMVSAKKIDIKDLESVMICSDGAWTQMFDRNKLKPEIFNMLVNNEYDELKEFLKNQNCFDDYSFIALDLQKRSMKKTA